GDLVGRGRQRGGAVDRDLVVVEENDKPGKLQVAGKVDRLVADTFHQAAVAGEDTGVVIDQVVADAGVEQALGKRHAGRTGEPLAISVPVAWPYWGVPAVRGPSWRKLRSSSIVMSA